MKRISLTVPLAVPSLFTVRMVKMFDKSPGRKKI